MLNSLDHSALHNTHRLLGSQNKLLLQSGYGSELVNQCTTTRQPLVVIRLKKSTLILLNISQVLAHLCLCDVGQDVPRNAFLVIFFFFKLVTESNSSFQIEASTRTHINETRHAHLDQLHDSAITLNQVSSPNQQEVNYNKRSDE